jgi:hypothetical protein
MNNKNNWIKNKIRMGWIYLSVGIILVVTGVFLQFQYARLPYNFRIVTGVGILLAAVGIANLVRYRAALRNEPAARRLNIEEKDERMMLIRARAGNRAFWVSSVLIYSGLMWASFAANGRLPDLTGDTLWFFLAACVLIPFGVYIANIVIDQRNS